ncbi:uncharacterized protein LOC144914764 [Branchiostoma floridae x Branchiostoma belcheri]
MASPMGTASHVRMDVDLDKVYGTIYGQCTGDAIGLLTEFMDKRKAHQYYQRPLEYHMKVSDRHRNSWRTGDWTDDSDQMILIMQALTQARGKVSDQALRTFSGDLYTWMLDGFRELGDRGGCGLGRTTHTVLTHPEFFDNPQKAAREVWESTGQAAAPNGAVMRTSILGVHQFWDLDSVGENAKLFCQTTHADPRCVASCVAVTTAIAQMLQGETDVEKIIHNSFSRASAYLDHKKQVDELRWYMDPRQLEELQLDAPGVIGYTYKTLGAGFWALRQDDFRVAIERITMEAGDADTNAAVAGALLGCKLGMKSLPETWLKMPHKNWLDRQISKYLHAVGLVGKGSTSYGRATRRDGEGSTTTSHHYSNQGEQRHTTEAHRHTTEATHRHTTEAHRHTTEAHRHTTEAAHRHTPEAHRHTTEDHRHTTEAAHRHTTEDHRHAPEAHRHTTEAHKHTTEAAHRHTTEAHRHTTEAHRHTTEAHRHTVQSSSLSSGYTTQGKHRERTSGTAHETHMEGVRNAHRGSEKTRSKPGGLADSVSIRLPPKGTKQHTHEGYNPNRSGHAGLPHSQNLKKSAENPQSYAEARDDQYPHRPGRSEPPPNQKPDLSHKNGDQDRFVTSYAAAYGQEKASSELQSEPRSGKHGSVGGTAAAVPGDNTWDNF